MKSLLFRLTLLLVPLTGLQAQTSQGQSLSETHRFLAAYEGTWTEEVSVYEADNAGKFTLTAVINTILGGRFLQCSQTGEMNAFDFEGLITLGYNDSSGIFTFYQIGTETTLTLVTEGHWKEPGRSISLEEITNPEDKRRRLRQVITFEDHDNIRIENFITDANGASIKNKEYHLSRQ